MRGRSEMKSYAKAENKTELLTSAPRLFHSVHVDCGFHGKGIASESPRS